MTVSLKNMLFNKRLLSLTGFVFIHVYLVWLQLLVPFSPPTFSPFTTNGLKYSNILNRYSFHYFGLSNPVLAIVVYILLAVVLIYKVKSCLLTLLIVPVWIFGGFLFLFVAADDYTVLDHVRSVEFNDKKYNLARSSGIYSGMDAYLETVILHECDLDNRNCYGRELEMYGGSIKYAAINIDEVRNQLRVFVEYNSEFTDPFIFTLNEGEALRDSR